MTWLFLPKILSSCTHSQVVPNLYTLYFLTRAGGAICNLNVRVSFTSTNFTCKKTALCCFILQTGICYIILIIKIINKLVRSAKSFTAYCTLFTYQFKENSLLLHWIIRWITLFHAIAINGKWGLELETFHRNTKTQ